MAHDIDYMNIGRARKQGKIDARQARHMVRDSDNRLVAGLKRAKGDGGVLNKFNAAASSQIIQGKKKLEDAGVLTGEEFIGDGLKDEKEPCGRCKRCKNQRKCKWLLPNFKLRRMAKGKPYDPKMKGKGVKLQVITDEEERKYNLGKSGLKPGGYKMLPVKKDMELRRMAALLAKNLKARI